MAYKRETVKRGYVRKYDEGLDDDYNAVQESTDTLNIIDEELDLVDKYSSPEKEPLNIPVASIGLIRSLYLFHEARDSIDFINYDGNYKKDKADLTKRYFNLDRRYHMLYERLNKMSCKCTCYERL